MPGKFTSDLVLRKDGTFSFTYKGDIHLMALSKMAAEERERKNASATFEPSPCYNEENGEERPCSGNEIADQKATWEEDLAASKAAAEVLVDCYAQEVRNISKVRVAIVNPGATRTVMRAKAYPGEDPLTLPEPSEIAPLVVQLAQADLGPVPPTGVVTGSTPASGVAG